MVENIVNLCKANKLSVNKLEKLCGISCNSIYRWDVHAPSVDKVKAVADYFGITVDELITEKEVNNAVHKNAC